MLVRFDTEEERVEQRFGLNVHLSGKVVAFSKSNTPSYFPVRQPPGLARRLQLELRPHANRLEVGGF